MKINISNNSTNLAQTSRLDKSQTIQSDSLNLNKSFLIKQDGKELKITLSDEYVEFKNDLKQVLEEDMNIQEVNSDNVFSHSSNDQWQVFSKLLSDEGFYDSLSKEETTNMDAILEKITSGLDSMAEQRLSFGQFNVTTHMDSYEAQVEKVSSVAALSYFSEKFLSGDMKASFDSLIGEYEDHNAKSLENYKSLEEVFFSFRAEITTIEMPKNAEAAENLSITNKLAKTEYSDEDKETLNNKLKDMFESLKNDKDISALDSVYEQLIDYVMKDFLESDSNYEVAKDFVNTRVEDTFNRMEEYWTMLF